MPLEEQKIDDDIKDKIDLEKQFKDYLSKIKGKKIMENRPSDIFLKRYSQYLRGVFRNKSFLNAVREIRKELEIEPGGFSVIKSESGLLQWLEKYRENNFKKVSKGN